MSIESPTEAADEHHMERRIIRVENLPDQAGIAAALKRAFVTPPPQAFRDDDCFAALLKAIH